VSQRKKPQKFSPEFKEKAVKRILSGESPGALSKELGVLRKDLYLWKRRYRNGEPLTSRPGPRPKNRSASGTELDRAQKRIGELERKVGQQALELDFFAKALRCVESAAEPSNNEARSTSASARKQRKAN
jgi:transposase-like protein